MFSASKIKIMLIRLRIIVLLTKGLSSYGSSLTELPRLSEEGSVSLSPQNNTEGKSVDPFQEIQTLKANMETLQTQVAKLNAEVAQLMQYQKPFTDTGVNQTTHFKARAATVNGTSSSNPKDVAALKLQVAQLTQYRKRAETSIHGAEAKILDMATLLKAMVNENGTSSSNRKDIAALKLQVAQLMQNREHESIHDMTMHLNALSTVNGSSSTNRKDVEALKLRADASIQNKTALLEDIGTVNGTSSSNRKGKCPPAASRKEGKVIETFCYLVSAISLNFSQAQNACNVLDGNLAQPLPILAFNHRLFTTLKGVFPTEFGKIMSAAVNPGRLWIGYKQGTIDAGGGIFTGQTSALVTVDIGSVIFNKKVETAVQEGLAITDKGFWEIFPLSKRLPYLCQFPLI